MKRQITATGLLSLVAMIVVGVFSTGSALAGGGPNSVFSWTGPLPGLVLVLNDNKQIFTTEPGGVQIECAHFGGHSIASNGKAMTTKEVTLTGLYTKCEAIGLNATVSPAEFLLNADGSASILKAIVITIPALGCSLKVDGGAANKNLRLILYLNRPEDILAHVEITSIKSLASGGSCGTAGQEKLEGEYKGLFLAFVDGGTLQWREK
jgi:hypothetical protein